MEWIELFHFLRPWWLLCGLPAFWLWWRLRNYVGTTSLWRNVVDPELLHHLLQSDDDGGKSVQWHWLVAAGWFVCTLALAGPSWEQQDTATFRNVTERVLVLDLSHSMDAEDIKPSRLGRVRQKVEDILSQSGEVENAVVVFAASPFVVSPLTSDAATIRSMLPALSVDIMPAQGSRAGLALEKGRLLLQGVRSKKGQVLLFTDSAVDSDVISAAAAIAADGLSLSVIGVGSDEGAPIPHPRGGFIKDGSGNIVVAQLDEAGLRKLADVGGGQYRRISSDESDINQLLQVGSSDYDSAARESQQSVHAWLDRGPWFVLLLLPLTAVMFRRGWL